MLLLLLWIMQQLGLAQSQVFPSCSLLRNLRHPVERMQLRVSAPSSVCLRHSWPHHLVHRSGPPTRDDVDRRSGHRCHGLHEPDVDSAGDGDKGRARARVLRRVLLSRTSQGDQPAQQRSPSGKRLLKETPIVSVALLYEPPRPSARPSRSPQGSRRAPQSPSTPSWSVLPGYPRRRRGFQGEVAWMHPHRNPLSAPRPTLRVKRLGEGSVGPRTRNVMRRSPPNPSEGSISCEVALQHLTTKPPATDTTTCTTTPPSATTYVRSGALVPSATLPGWRYHTGGSWSMEAVGSSSQCDHRQPRRDNRRAQQSSRDDEVPHLVIGF